jgi:predicted RNA binding protein YcfA (HicA-like mRNA interferase family)
VAKLPVISGADAVKAFQRAGWSVDRQKGSHVVLLKPGHIASLSVPQHPELARHAAGRSSEHPE